MELPETRRAPGIVMFAAILNFISTAFAALGIVMGLAGLLFGNALGFTEAFSRQLAEVQSRTNVAYGMTLVFGLLSALSLSLFAYFLAVALGLLKGKKFAWFTQIAMSILGLIGFPIWTILNGVILYMFFQPRVRDWFKV